MNHLSVFIAKYVMATTIESILKGNSSLSTGSLKYTIAGLESRQNTSKASMPIDIPMLSMKDRKISGAPLNSTFTSSNFSSQATINLKDFRATKINKSDLVKSLDEVHTSIVSYLNIINKNTGQIFNFVKEVDNRAQIGLSEVRKTLDITRVTQDSLDKKILKFDYRLKQIENKPVQATVWNKPEEEEDTKKKEEGSGWGIAAAVAAAAAAVVVGGHYLKKSKDKTFKEYDEKNPGRRLEDMPGLTEEQKKNLKSLSDSSWRPRLGYNPNNPKNEEYGPFKEEFEEVPGSAQSDPSWIEKRQNQLKRRKQNILDKQSKLHEENGEQNNLPAWAQVGMYKVAEWGAWGASLGTRAATVVNPAAWGGTAIGMHEFVKRGITDDVKEQFEKTGKLEIKKGSLGDMYGAFSWMQEQLKKKDQPETAELQKMSLSEGSVDTKGLSPLHLRKSEITLEALNDIKIVALREITAKSRKITLDADQIVIDSPNIVFTSEPNKGISGFVKAAYPQDSSGGPQNSMVRPPTDFTKPSQEAPDPSKPSSLPGGGFLGGNVGPEVTASPSPSDDVLGGMPKTLPGLPQKESSAPSSTDNQNFLAQKRSAFAKELEDPKTRRLLGAIISAENPGAGPAVVESLMNRTEFVNEGRAKKGLPPLTLNDMIMGHPSIDKGQSFYGPVRNNAIASHLQKMDNPKFAEKMNKNIDQAVAGSNVIQSHTDQGSAGDPNYERGGKGVNINGERFNDWNPKAQAWREQRQQDISKNENQPQERTASAVMGGESIRQMQSNIRNQPINATLKSQLEYAARQSGLRVDVYSGGQPSSGPHRTGSHRHDDGGAADLKLFDPKLGRYLNSSNAEDRARMKEFTTNAVKAGATGVGAGYMGPESLHIGGGKAASWGGAPWIEAARLAGAQNQMSPSQLVDYFKNNPLADANPAGTKTASIDPNTGLEKETPPSTNMVPINPTDDVKSFSDVAAQADEASAQRNKITSEQAPNNMGPEPIALTPQTFSPENNQGPYMTRGFSKEDQQIPSTSFNPEKEPGRPGNEGGRGGSENDPDGVGLDI